MASIIKVQDIQNTSGANIINESSNTITIGASGDNIIIPSGATITNNGTASGFGKSATGCQMQLIVDKEAQHHLHLLLLEILYRFL
jgi:hypothetical protein